MFGVLCGSLLSVDLMPAGILRCSFGVGWEKVAEMGGGVCSAVRCGALWGMDVQHFVECG